MLLPSAVYYTVCLIQLLYMFSLFFFNIMFLSVVIIISEVLSSVFIKKICSVHLYLQVIENLIRMRNAIMSLNLGEFPQLVNLEATLCIISLFDFLSAKLSAHLIRFSSINHRVS